LWLSVSIKIFVDIRYIHDLNILSFLLFNDTKKNTPLQLLKDF
jgi:hypothetical protein